MSEKQITKNIRKRRGILLIAVYAILEAALFGSFYTWNSKYLYNLSIMLTPLAFVYINSTCFGGTWPQTWSGKRWTAVATGWLVATLGVTWILERLL